MSPLRGPIQLNDYDFSALTGAGYGGYGSPQVGYAPEPAYTPMALPSALTGGGGGGLAGFSPASIGGYNGVLKPSFNYDTGAQIQPGGGFAPNYGSGAGPGPAPQKQGIGTMGYVQAGIDGLQTLGNLWMGFKQMKLANKSFKFNKDMAETNLANTMKAYNTSLADRARSRGFTEGQNQGEIDRYVAANSATRVR